MTIALLVLAAAALWLGGYLAAARRGRDVRERLWALATERAERIGVLEAAVAQGEAAARDGAALRARVEDLVAPMMRQEEGVRAATAQLQAQVRGEMQRALAPLLEKERAAGELQATLGRLLAPMTERERVSESLAHLEPATRGRAGLSPLLSQIAGRVGLDALLLSDEAGLLLAAEGEAQGAVALAGLSSMLFTLADRTAATGAPAPIGLVIHDEANRLLLHRMFRVNDERYVLTGIARGRLVTPSTLDPALGRIQEILAGVPLAAAAR